MKKNRCHESCFNYNSPIIVTERLNCRCHLDESEYNTTPGSTIIDVYADGSPVLPFLKSLDENKKKEYLRWQRRAGTKGDAVLVAGYVDDLDSTFGLDKDRLAAIEQLLDEILVKLDKEE